MSDERDPEFIVELWSALTQWKITSQQRTEKNMSTRGYYVVHITVWGGAGCREPFCFRGSLFVSISTMPPRTFHSPRTLPGTIVFLRPECCVFYLDTPCRFLGSMLESLIANRSSPKKELHRSLQVCLLLCQLLDPPTL